MKKYLLFFIAISISMVANSQNDDLKDGPYKTYHKNGKIKVEGQYKNKQRVGEWKSYYDTGELLSLYSYSKGKKNKEYIVFYKDGSLKRETKKIDGDFISKGFYENGNLFFQRLIKDGYYKEYYNNGILKVESNYLDFELAGVWKHFYNSGELEWEIMYKDGYRDGVYKQFYRNGNLKLEGLNKKNKKEGVEKRYTEDGLLKWEGTYKNDVFNKTWNYFDASGNKVETVKYKKGKRVNSNSETSLTETVIPEGNLETVPVYPGCESALGNNDKRNCMSKKIAHFVNKRFNTKIIDGSGLSGKQQIKVLFKIDKTGKVINASAIGSHPDLEEEAIRVVKLLPIIQPGMQRGKVITVPFKLPLNFDVKSTSKEVFRDPFLKYIDNKHR